jgi:hypothetical protein
MTKRFPIIIPHTRKLRKICDELDCPRSIPWELIAPKEEQAKNNHDQSLKELASRCGLDPAEAVAVLEGKDWRDFREPYLKSASSWSVNTEKIIRESVVRLKELVKEFEKPKRFMFSRRNWTISNHHPGDCVHIEHRFIHDDKLTCRTSIRLEENMQEDLEDLYELLSHVLHKN